MLTLYTYFRSSAAYRVRIALNLKRLDYSAIPVHLLRDGGQHHQPGYRELNPLEVLPTLQHQSITVTQSLAILEYLEEAYPSPPLLPADVPGRARVRALALTIACDIHPLNNLRVLQYLEGKLGVDQISRDEWYRHWVNIGFTAIERLLEKSSAGGRFCHADTPSVADCCLVPQVFNAQRLRCPLEEYPELMRIYANCTALDAFQRAAPQLQPDAE
ncbi:MAG: maleylpyruvate isomerase [Gammaproteobacteria bacterium]|nr:maleylpyruvate isomerase [Gammaproteobacteria bacterium]